MDPMFGAAAIGAASDIAGGFLTNRFNASQARKMMDFQSSSAREMMRFQERMSNTAWQRGVEDMRKAGINPMVAFSQGGASTPPGASAAGAQSSAQNPLSGVGRHITSALALKNMQAQLDNIQANTRKQNMDTKQVESSISLNKSQEHINRLNATLLGVSTANELNRSVVLQAEAARARNQLGYENSWMGKSMPYIQGATNAVGGIMGVGGSATALIHSAKALKGLTTHTHETMSKTKSGHIRESVSKRY